jgi:hypothetical protein
MRPYIFLILIKKIVAINIINKKRLWLLILIKKIVVFNYLILIKFNINKKDCGV